MAEGMAVTAVTVIVVMGVVIRVEDVGTVWIVGDVTVGDVTVVTLIVEGVTAVDVPFCETKREHVLLDLCAIQKFRVESQNRESKKSLKCLVLICLS